MRAEQIYDAITGLSDKLIGEAQAFSGRKKSTPWVKYTALAACAALVVGLGWQAIQPHTPFGGATGSTATDGSIANVAQLYGTDQPQQLEVELVAWQFEGFRAIVVTGDDAGLFPVDGELLVFFEDETEIFLADGTTFPYTADDPCASEIGWEEGTMVSVTFSTYEEYQPGNHFYNRVYASHVALTAE